MKSSSPTLRDRINRVAYVVLNVTDLERSRRFYESVTPLRVANKFNAPTQPFLGLGLEQGAFSAYAMTDGNGAGRTEVHLVEWTEPATHGTAYEQFWHVGLAKIAFTVPSAKDKLAELAQLQIPTTNRLIYRNYVTIQDPDGIIISFPGLAYEAPENPAPPALVHTNPSVRDIDRGYAFYAEFLGLDLAHESRPAAPIESSQGPGSVLSRWDSHLYQARGDQRFSVDYSQFHYPEPTPETLTPYESATNVGISRLGFEVDDIDRSADIALDAVEAGAEFSVVGPVEEWDLGSYGRRRVLCMTDPDGIRIELIEKKIVEPMTGFASPPNPEPAVSLLTSAP
ncbi:VOC family protein [Pseudarthrobacter sp. lyk4-40-TYG-27]|uniref:VOC family protein n=1 Tax=Pseudarthrobacter sp. lyk4-40-TYG-27 TaxID=3040305 RepID=UPI0025565E4F|nr:VOC family protein [Pseudarthrobacter sp. lyk4-40-TYG-27]